MIGKCYFYPDNKLFLSGLIKVQYKSLFFLWEGVAVVIVDKVGVYTYVRGFVWWRVCVATFADCVCGGAVCVDACDGKMLVTEDLPTGGPDVDIQLLEASKAGDLELIKVRGHTHWQ